LAFLFVEGGFGPLILNYLGGHILGGGQSLAGVQGAKIQLIFVIGLYV